MLSNEKIGWIIYACAVFSCLTVGIADGFFNKNCDSSESEFSVSLPVSQAVVKAVNDATKGMFIICAYVIIFSCIFSILGNFPAKQYIMPLFEITSGTAVSKGKIPLELLAGYISFGGLCIHMQVFDTVTKSGHTFFSFFQYRLLCSLLTALLFSVVTRFFPITQDVFSNISQSTHTFASVSTAASISMIVMCVVMIFDIDSKKKKI